MAGTTTGDGGNEDGDGNVIVFGFGNTVGIDGTGMTKELGTVVGTAHSGTKMAVVEEIMKTQAPVGAYVNGMMTPVVG